MRYFVKGSGDSDPVTCYFIDESGSVFVEEESDEDDDDGGR